MAEGDLLGDSVTHRTRKDKKAPIGRKTSTNMLLRTIFSIKVTTAKQNLFFKLQINHDPDTKIIERLKTKNYVCRKPVKCLIKQAVRPENAKNSDSYKNWV